MQRIGIAVVIALILAGGVTWWNKTHTSQSEPAALHTTHISLGDTSISADIADTDALREQGLSGRKSLTDTEGMLFVFQEDGEHSFWMKEMLFSLDMIWLSADKTVVYIQKNATPESYPATFSPHTASRYVIEVPAGFAVRHHVVVGSRAVFK